MSMTEYLSLSHLCDMYIYEFFTNGDFVGSCYN